MLDMTMTPEDAREYSESLQQIGSGWWRQVALAFRLGAHSALGLTRREWAERYHGYIRLDPEARIEAERELMLPESEGGMGLGPRATADVLGVSHTQVRRDQDRGTYVPPGREELPTDQGEPIDSGTYVPPESMTVDRVGWPDGDYIPPAADEDMWEAFDATPALAQSDVPVLTSEETTIAGADVMLPASVPQPRHLDQSRNAVGQENIVRSMSELAAKLRDHSPYLLDDTSRDVSVLAARDTVRRLVDAATVWIRTLNAMYTEQERS